MSKATTASYLSLCTLTKKPNSFEKLRTNLEKVVKQTEEIKLKDFDSKIKIVFFLSVEKDFSRCADVWQADYKFEN